MIKDDQWEYDFQPDRAPYPNPTPAMKAAMEGAKKAAPAKEPPAAERPKAAAEA